MPKKDDKKKSRNKKKGNNPYTKQAENTVSAPLNAAKFIRSRSKYNKALQEAMESGFGN